MLDALRKLVPDQPFNLKWPNDVLLHGRKLAGILLELVPAPENKFRLVIGFGMNVAIAPSSLDRPVICLADIGATGEIETIAVTVLASLSGWIDRFEAQDFGPVREAWLAVGHRPGCPLTVTQGAARLEGTFVDIAEDGGLLLQCGDQQVKIAGGEVSASQANWPSGNNQS